MDHWRPDGGERAMKTGVAHDYGSRAGADGMRRVAVRTQGGWLG